MDFDRNTPISFLTVGQLEDLFTGLLKEAVPEPSEKEDEDETLTLEETMDRLGKSRTTLWSWHKRGYLKCIKVGSSVRYSKKAVDKLLKDKN